MSWYTFFEILLYLVAATLLGVGVGWVLRSGRSTGLDAPEATDEPVAPVLEASNLVDKAELQRAMDEAETELAAKSIEIKALVDEVAALRRVAMTRVSVTSRFVPNDDPDDDPDEPSPAGTLDSWPLPGDETPRPENKDAYDELSVLVVHLRKKLFEATRASRRAIEEREALSVELKASRKVRNDQVDSDVRLEVDIAERDAEIDALRDRLEAANHEIEVHAEQVSRLHDQLGAAHRQISDLEAAVRSVADDRDSAQEWSETVQAEVYVLRARIDAWEQRKADLEAALEAFRAPFHEERIATPPPLDLDPGNDEAHP